MKKITRLAAVALVTLFGWQANAQDGLTCDTPFVVTPGAIDDAQITAGSGSATQATATDALYYSYTPTGDGTIDISSCASDPSGVDTRLFVYTACPATAGTEVYNDDDGCDAPNGFGSVITDAAVVGGTTYIIQWDDRWENAPFDWTLSFTPAPTGDTCAEALPVTPGTYLEAAINDSDATTNTGDALWYVYTPDTNGSITVNSGIDPDEPDTRLFIYDNCTDLNVLDSDDDDGPGFTSIIEDFPVVAGTPYYIAWDDRWSLDPFDWELVFSSCPTPTDFAVAAGQTDAVFTWTDDASAVNGYVLDVYTDGADPAVDMPVYTENVALGVATATATGLTDTTAYDAYLTADCDTSGSSTSTMLDFSTTPPPPVCGGKFYDTGGPDGDFMNSEDYQVTISPDVVGDVVTASFVFVDNAGGGFDTLTVDIGDGNFVLVPDVALGDPPVEFTSIAADGSLLFNFVSSAVVPNPGWDADIICGPPPTCPEPTNFAVDNITDATADFTWEEVTEAADGYTLSVFNDGDDPAVDTPVYTEDVAAGTLMATASGLTGTTVYNAYINANCGAGDLSSLEQLNFTTLGTPGPNATCETALVVTPGMYIGQIVDANTGTNNGDSLWYSYTPDADGTVTISSCLGGDNDDTRVFFSEGPCDALTPIADDDDGCDAPDGFGSIIEDVAVTAGTEYFIQWDDRWSTTEFDWEFVFTGIPCAAPENIVVSNETGTGADVSWDLAPTAVQGYQVAAYVAGDFTTPVSNSPVLPATTTMYTVTGLDQDTAYDVYVISLCDLSADPQDVSYSDPVPLNTILGSEDFNTLDVSFFPNPTTGIVTINSKEEVQSINVYSVLGQEVLKSSPNSTSFEINLSNVANGTYFVKATSNDATSVIKVIKE